MQRELADRVGISASMLSLLEAGKRDPTIRTLSQLARALGVPTAALFAVALADIEDTNAAAQLRAMTQSLAKATHHVTTITRLRRSRGA